MRLAGTCSRYSNSAMPQLASAAMNQGLPERFLRCAYQAKVMNTFDRMSRPVAASVGDRFSGMGVLEGVFGQPGGCLAQASGLQRAVTCASHFSRCDQLAAFQHTQMLH